MQKPGGLEGEFGVRCTLPDILPLPFPTLWALGAFACNSHVVLLGSGIQRNPIGCQKFQKITFFHENKKRQGKPVSGLLWRLALAYTYYYYKRQPTCEAPCLSTDRFLPF